MRWNPTRNERITALVGAGALALSACSGDAGVRTADAAAAVVTTVTPSAISVSVVEVPSTVDTTVPPATEAPTTAVPATEAPTTVVDTTVAPATTATPETTVPPETVPVETTEPPPTTIDPYSLLEPAPPATQLATAIGSLSGDGARVVQQRLLDLGFWLAGVDGDYGLTTRQAVMAFQKYNGLATTGKVDQATADVLNLTSYRARGVSTQGDLIEVNKDLQLLFVIQGGHTTWVLNTSTANGQPYEEPDRNTPGEIQRGLAVTPSGLYQVNRERPEGWWEGDLGKIYRPKYFRGGIAVHGSGSVPNYPASHGCVRVSVQAMDMIWENNLMPMDFPVWVYGNDPPIQS